MWIKAGAVGGDHDPTESLVGSIPQRWGGQTVGPKAQAGSLGG